MLIRPFGALLVTAGLFCLAACKNDPQAESLSTNIDSLSTPALSAEDSIVAIVSAGEVQWEASKPAYKHNGTLSVSKGSLVFRDSMLSGGEFTLDMNSVQVSDLSGEDKSDLETHLKEGDFFETQRFPEARFTIRSATPRPAGEEWNYNISGDLTLKDSTRSVSFPVRIERDERSVKAVTPQFTIRRTDWGINYKSGILNTVKDQIINDDLGIKILLEASF